MISVFSPIRRTTAVFLSVLLPFGLIAGGSEKRAVATRTTVAPVIDGRLGDRPWSFATPVTDFTQSEPLEGTQPTQPTEIRILYDNDALYIGCMMYDSSPERIGRRLARRDEEIDADHISVRIDSYHDHQTAYEFTISAAGVKIDVLQFNDAREEDVSWDVVWEGKTAVTDSGWSAEMRIPFAVLRFPPAGKQEWGIQFIRTIERNRERQMWALILKSESGVVSRFGHLEGIEGISPQISIEVLPYVVGSTRSLASPIGLQESPDYSMSAGLDLKFKPSSEWAIDATINPDFGQVEADPAVLNLSTFETFYPERRPFFVEGSQILRFTTFGGDFGPGLYYSRRIGKALSVDAPDGGYVLEDPRFVTILGAAKVSGRMANGVSVGILEAVTREEHAVVVDSLGNQEEVQVEPLANYGLVRVRKDVLENSNVGMIATAVSKQRQIPAITGGLDWNLKFARNE
ncbi:MAG: carbohydrate binding family 9 domain-containing protein, partial [Proteobacteria bacterium]|nr:carbohydrate binding family 9 domain-containing protein [Pseudomonadota bacterium]